LSEGDVVYGAGPRQRVDLFFPPGRAKGAVVFVHGGYWMRFDKAVWSYLAAGPLAHGWAVAMPGYDLCPDVRIGAITQQIAQAVGFVADRVPGPLCLTGHSAGGHLAARMVDPALRHPWQARVQAVVPISPVADLVPLLRTSMNATLQLDLAEATAESPVRQAPPDLPVTIWVGANERPVFVEQASALSRAWSCGLTVQQGRHHFDVIDDLADPGSEMVETLLG
jgi:acetyl esterase/lipase